MKRKRVLRMMRYPRTTQERRENGKRSNWARAKRSASNLPSSFDDLFVVEEKTWKHKRKNQYRCGSRGKRHVVEMPACMETWDILEKLDIKDIPHDIEKIAMYEDGYLINFMYRITYWGENFPA